MASFNPELVAAARRHAPDAWDALLKQHQLPLYTYVAELLRDRETALDVVQETFVAAVRHIGTLRDDDRFGSWLFCIAHQKCVQQWRRTRRTDALFAPGPQDDNLDAWPEVDEPDPLTALLRREQADEFFATLDQLSEPHRAVLLLHVLEDFSIEEIACITSVPPGTVKSRLHHAKRALRQRMEVRP